MTRASETGAAHSTGTLRLGSLVIHVDAPRPIYLEDLAAIYGVPLHDAGDVQFAGLHLEIVEVPGPPSVEVPPDGMVITPDGTLHTEAMFAQTALGGGESRVRLTVLTTALREDKRHMYLVVLLNKIFFWMGYTRLHASAISLDGKGSIFIGDRGAGKSSICAYLAGRGGLVLADDDVMLHYDGNSCAVSGCDETMKFMDDAEKHLFGRLDVPVADFGGIPKKEIVTAERFATEPYVNHGLDRIFYPRVGEGFAVKRMSSSQLVMRLMSTLVQANRFAGAQDPALTLGYVVDVADQVAAYELNLSRDFDGLDQLFGFLKSAAG